METLVKAKRDLIAAYATYNLQFVNLFKENDEDLIDYLSELLEHIPVALIRVILKEIQCTTARRLMIRALAGLNQQIPNANSLLAHGLKTSILARFEYFYTVDIEEFAHDLEVLEWFYAIRDQEQEDDDDQGDDQDGDDDDDDDDGDGGDEGEGEQNQEEEAPANNNNNNNNNNGFVSSGCSSSGLGEFGGTSNGNKSSILGKRNRKEFSGRWEMDRYLSASGYLEEITKLFFVALLKDKTTGSGDEFREQISQVDQEAVQHLLEDIKGGFDDEKNRSFVGFSRLSDFLESGLHKRYKEAAPATLALLEHRCGKVTSDLARMETKIEATSDVAHLRKSAMLYAACICNHVGALIEGAADPAPELWGRTTDQEQSESGIGSWPGVKADIKPPNASLHLYGRGAFERVIHEFRCASYSIECPHVSSEKVANILLAHAGQGGGRGVTETAAEIARAGARSWLAPLLDTACDRLAFVLRNLFDLAIERNLHQDSNDRRKTGEMDGYIGFHAALRQSYILFIKDLAKQCKKVVRHHLDSITSPYSQVCYENHSILGFSSINRINQASACAFSLELSDTYTFRNDSTKDQENIHPEKNGQESTPGKVIEGREALRESLTVLETPSPGQPSERKFVGVKKELGNAVEVGARKRQSRTMGYGRNLENFQIQNGGAFFIGNEDSSRSGSAYSEICSLASQHFAHIRDVLIEQSAAWTLNSGFLTPCRDRLAVALGLDLFAISDEKFMDMFVAPSAMDFLQNERHSLQKR